MFIKRQEIGVYLWEEKKIDTVASFLYSDPKFLVEIGNYYFSSESNKVYNISRAERYFKKAIKKDPHVLDAWHQLARIYFLRGEYNKALYYIDNQIYYHGDKFMAAYYIQGLIYAYGGDFISAQKSFQIFLRWDTKNWATHNDLAWAYFQDGKYEESYATAMRGLLFSPHNPWLLNMAGVSLLNQEKKVRAKPYFEAALTEAKKLTSTEWVSSYPGNDPRVAQQGLSEMLEAIKKNIEKASQ